MFDDSFIRPASLVAIHLFYLVCLPEKRISYMNKNPDTIRIKNLVQEVMCVNPRMRVKELKEKIGDEKPLYSAIVVDGDRVAGLIMSHHIDRVLSHLYGVSLYHKKTVDSVMDANPLIVSGDMPIEEAADRAMRRDAQKRYDHIIVVTHTSKVSGVVSIRKILGALAELQKNRYTELMIYNQALEKEIGERRRVETELRNSEGKYRLLFNHAPAGIYEIDFLTGRLVRVNEIVCEYTGYTRDELLTMNIIDLLTPESKPKFLDRLRKDFNGIDPRNNLEYEIRKKDGSTMWVMLRAKYLYQDSKIVGASVVVHDITDRKKQETELKEKEERYRQLFENSVNAVIIIDHESGLIEDVNSTALKLFNLSREDSRNLKLSDIVVKENDDDAGELINFESLQEQSSFNYHFKWFKRKDDSVFPGDLYLSRFYTDGKLKVIVAVRDNSERKQLEDQLHQAHKMEAIGTLAGGIAHDFNNILGAIIGYTELSMGEAEKNSFLHRNLNEVLVASMRAKDLVQHILTFARQNRTEMRPLQLKLIVKEALKLLRATLPSSIRIIQNIHSAATVNADPTQMHQIVMNLCTNASQAMREKGDRIEIALVEASLSRQRAKMIGLNPRKEYVCLSVKDNGSGMPAGILEKIFDPYFTTKEKGQGTGMGLAVVQGIVKNCGGAIDVQSQPGAGSCFEVYLPVIERSMLVNATAVEKPPPRGTERILLVDDEPAVSDMASKMLIKLGYKVTVRTSSIEALELFKSRSADFDLVISDMTMPNITGDRLAEEMVKIKPEIPIIICTGYSEKINSRECDMPGVKLFAYKPLTFRDLAVAVRHAFGETD